ncbi:MAG: hypothetical protein M3Y57_12760 [Acidobacteriota bacterium]|nr:hypothetical protein [Acidobacteriota bacterium]
MKKLIVSILVVFGGPVLFADSLTCTADDTNPPTTPILCSSSSLIFSVPSPFPSFAIFGNSIGVDTSIDVSSGVPRSSTTFAEAILIINDTFTIPNSPPGDVLKVTANYGVTGLGEAEPGSNVDLSFQIGPGSASSPEINLDPYKQPPADCGPSGEPGGCHFMGTLPASAFSFVTINATGTLIARTTLHAGFGFTDDIEIDRFKADGTTPDPFTTTTPEPASRALALAGLLLLGFLQHRHRS